MFTLLLFGGYSAYKHFSGLDPLKIDPQSVMKNILGAKNPTEFLSVLSALKVNLPTQKGSQPSIPNQVGSSSPTQLGSNYLFRFMIIADSHNDNQNLKKAITQAKASYPDTAFIIGLGDYTDVGTLKELKSAKADLDSSGLRYFLVAGDHDLWDSRNNNLAADTNFKTVFGPTYQSFNYNGFKFLLLDNSDNYKGITNEQKNWLTSELERAKTEGNSGILVFIHEPLFHPSSDHYMGKIETELKSQAESLLFQLKASSVKKIFSGDIHYFSQYEEPITKLPMITVGALVTERNPQLPRFAIVYVYQDGKTLVEDVELR